MARATARIIEDVELNDREQKQACVYATCVESEDTAGPVWGTGEASRKRALAQLSEICGCGATFHEEAEE